MRHGDGGFGAVPGISGDEDFSVARNGIGRASAASWCEMASRGRGGEAHMTISRWPAAIEKAYRPADIATQLYREEMTEKLSAFCACGAACHGD